MPAIPLDVMLWISLGIFGLGVLALIPIWWRGRRARRGEFLPIDEQDVTDRNVAGTLLTLGFGSILSTVLVMASRAMPFAAFMVMCAVGTMSIIALAFRVDAIRARRQR